MNNTEERTAVVKGGASGIGQEYVRQLRAIGWRVVGKRSTNDAPQRTMAERVRYGSGAG
ncbi:MAG: hypothetical protein CBARDMAM_6476 [uncultured Caballeronia sp.]|nr:MAG: hypothetical protein CBARDMAM_6476 [uncultured Caballeronia sp.]